MQTEPIRIRAGQPFLDQLGDQEIPDPLVVGFRTRAVDDSLHLKLPRRIRTSWPPAREKTIVSGRDLLEPTTQDLESAALARRADLRGDRRRDTMAVDLPP